MKKPVILPVLVLLFCVTQSIAQNKKQIISGNDDINAGIPDSIKYLYQAFTYGKVYYKDGKTGGALLNYNLLAGAVQFVNQSNDTLSLANEATLRLITINADTFCYDKLYVKMIASNEVMKLARNEKITLSDIRKGAGFDSYRSSGGVDNVSALNVGTRTVHLDDNKQLVFVVHYSWYIGDSYNHFLPATKKNVLKMFGKNNGLDTFISENRIDFAKEEDLRKLLSFANR